MLGALIHIRGEKLEVVPSLFLCVIHGSVGVLQQHVQVARVIWINADADARAYVDLMALDLKWNGELADDMFRDRGHGSHFPDAFDDHGKFITPEPANGVGFPHRLYESSSDRAQEQVADVVAQGIVDVFE